MKVVDSQGRLATQRAGRVTLIGHKAQVVEAWLVPGTSIVVLGGDQAVEDLRDWLREQPLDHAAKALGISRSAVGRMRKGLGLAVRYDKGSRTTRWREGKRG